MTQKVSKQIDRLRAVRHFKKTRKKSTEEFLLRSQETTQHGDNRDRLTNHYEETVLNRLYLWEDM